MRNKLIAFCAALSILSVSSAWSNSQLNEGQSLVLSEGTTQSFLPDLKILSTLKDLGAGGATMVVGAYSYTIRPILVWFWGEEKVKDLEKDMAGSALKLLLAYTAYYLAYYYTSYYLGIDTSTFFGNLTCYAPGCMASAIVTKAVVASGAQDKFGAAAQKRLENKIATFMPAKK